MSVLNFTVGTPLYEKLVAQQTAVLEQYGTRTWFKDYQAAAAGGAQSLANWMNQRTNTYADWDADSAAFASRNLTDLQAFEDPGDGFLGIKETQHITEQIGNVAGVIVPPILAASFIYAGGVALAGATGAGEGAVIAGADVAGGATVEAGAAGEIATGIDASTGLYAGESAYAGTATYGTVGGAAIPAASIPTTSSSWLDNLISKGTDYVKSKAESTILNVLKGGASGGTTAKNPGAPTLSAKQNLLPSGNLGAIYGFGSNYPAEGEFGTGSGYGGSGGSAAPSISTQLYVWLAVAAVGVISLIVFSKLARR